MKLALAAAAGVAVLLGASTADYQALGYTETVVAKSSVDHLPLILCKKPDGRTGQGTGVSIGNGMFITAEHVVRHACEISGEPVEVLYKSAALDFAVARVKEPFGAKRNYSCDRLRPGKIYLAQGHVGNGTFQLSVAYSGFSNFNGNGGFKGQAIFLGPVQFIPGMSGGEIIDPDTGKQVAVISGYSEELTLVSYGRLLRDTYLCSGENARS